MNNRRVVITGMGVVSPFGAGVDCLWQNLLAGNSAVRSLPDMHKLNGLRSKVAAIVPEIDNSAIPRKKRRFMSPMSVYASIASLEAIAKAGLADEQVCNRMTGLSMASTIGSSTESEAFFQEVNKNGSIENIKSTMFFKTMNHSCAANVAQALGIRGRIIAPSAACASSSLTIGLAYEMIVAGKQDIMLCGGADEHHCLATAVFDIMNAASSNYNDHPEKTPRPFDKDRDGVVCAEGAGVLVLEELANACKRGARILGEVVGFATCSAPEDYANPDSVTIGDCMKWAVRESGLDSADIGYVSAHATATTQGDIAESQAIASVMGSNVPVSSLKGHLGHTMAASAVMELIASIRMMEESILIPTRNLDSPDPECAVVDLVRDNRRAEVNVVLKNSFALGGINSTLIVRRDVND